MARTAWHDLDAPQGIGGWAGPPLHRAPPILPACPGADDRLPARLTHAVAATLKLWRARHRQRRCLAQLDTRALRDIGVTPYDAQREAATPFWR